jgi:hypothetical protein
MAAFARLADMQQSWMSAFSESSRPISLQSAKYDGS